ncbi:unnamed protein product [Ophioblennius macclurei]
MTPPPALLSATLLLLLLPTTLSDSGWVPIRLIVKNRLASAEDVVHDTHGVYGGVLLGAMRRLMASNSNFEFTYSEDPDYGPYLESVNGVAGNTDDRTYWELLVISDNGVFVPLDVGIGCYIPKEKDQIMLNFNTW